LVRKRENRRRRQRTAGDSRERAAGGWPDAGPAFGRLAQPVLCDRAAPRIRSGRVRDQHVRERVRIPLCPPLVEAELSQHRPQRCVPAARLACGPSPCDRALTGHLGWRNSQPLRRVTALRRSRTACPVNETDISRLIDLHPYGQPASASRGARVPLNSHSDKARTRSCWLQSRTDRLRHAASVPGASRGPFCSKTAAPGGGCGLGHRRRWV
jgi:hypothetical protein